MPTSSQPVPTGARGIRCETRWRDNRRAYVLANVRELPPRLERVVADGFGGLVASNAKSRTPTATINHPRGDLS